MQLVLVDWSPDASGQCHIMDASGNAIGQVTVHSKVGTRRLCLHPQAAEQNGIIKACMQQTA